MKKHNVPKFALNNETLKELDSTSEVGTTSNVNSVPKIRSVTMPRNWFKSSPSTSPSTLTKKTRGRERRRSTPSRQTRERDRRRRSPPKKYMFSDY